MKYKYYLLALMAGLMSFAGCYQDKGNYDYVELNEIVIDTEGFQMEYRIMMYDQLTIDPVITFTGGTIPESDLAYEWHIYQDGAPTSWEVASMEKKLDISFGMVPGEYKVVVYVTDTKHGISSSMTFDVTVLTDISHGILVLHGADGEGDMDYIITPNIIPDATTKRVGNVLGAQGRKLPGNPLTVYQHARNWGTMNALYASSDEELFLIDYSNLQVMCASDELFLDNPANKAVVRIGTQNDNRIFLTADGLLREIQSARPRWDFALEAPLAVSPLIAGEVRLSKEYTVPSGYSALYSPVLYDSAGKRFVGRQSYPLALAPFPVQQDKAVPKLDEYGDPVLDAGGNPVLEVIPKAFDINNIGKDILFLGRGFNSVHYAVFKDPGQPNYYLYSMDFNVASTLAATDIPKSVKDMSALTEMAGAKFFVLETLGDVLLYGTDRNIYVYDYAGSGTAAKINADFPAGEEITMVELYTQALAPSTTNERVLYVATWDGTQGKLYEFGFNPGNGQMTSQTPLNVFEGFGKIVDITSLYQFSQDPIPTR